MGITPILIRSDELVDPEGGGVLPAGAARLAAHIEIFSVELDPKLVAQDDFATDVTGWDGKDYGALAKKLSEAADALAGRIAALVPARNK